MAMVGFQRQMILDSEYDSMTAPNATIQAEFMCYRRQEHLNLMCYYDRSLYTSI